MAEAVTRTVFNNDSETQNKEKEAKKSDDSKIIKSGERQVEQ